MAEVRGTLRTCKNGHQFRKSSDCPICPICEAQAAPKDGFLSDISAPARRALEREGLTTLKKLAKRTEAQVLALHGVGPSSIPKLRDALNTEGLDFRS